MLKVIRSVCITDAEKLLAYFRELVVADPERVETVEDAQRMTVQDEEKWILSRREKMLAGNMYALCVEVANGEETSIVAVAEVERLPRQIESHMGEIRLGILPEYASYGTKIVQSLCHHAKEIGIESLLYTHFETQKIGIAIMKLCGFLRIGYIPDYYKRGGTYTGRIIMLLPKL